MRTLSVLHQAKQQLIDENSDRLGQRNESMEMSAQTPARPAVASAASAAASRPSPHAPAPSSVSATPPHAKAAGASPQRAADPELHEYAAESAAAIIQLTYRRRTSTPAGQPGVPQPIPPDERAAGVAGAESAAGAAHGGAHGAVAPAPHAAAVAPEPVPEPVPEPAAPAPSVINPFAGKGGKKSKEKPWASGFVSIATPGGAVTATGVAVTAVTATGAVTAMPTSGACATFAAAPTAPTAPATSLSGGVPAPSAQPAPGCALSPPAASTSACAAAGPHAQPPVWLAPHAGTAAAPPCAATGSTPSLFRPNRLLLGGGEGTGGASLSADAADALHAEPIAGRRASGTVAEPAHASGARGALLLPSATCTHSQADASGVAEAPAGGRRQGRRRMLDSPDAPAALPAPTVPPLLALGAPVAQLQPAVAMPVRPSRRETPEPQGGATEHAARGPQQPALAGSAAPALGTAPGLEPGGTPVIAPLGSAASGKVWLTLAQPAADGGGSAAGGGADGLGVGASAHHKGRRRAGEGGLSSGPTSIDDLFAPPRRLPVADPFAKAPAPNELMQGKRPPVSDPFGAVPDPADILSYKRPPAVPDPFGGVPDATAAFASREVEPSAATRAPPVAAGKPAVAAGGQPDPSSGAARPQASVFGAGQRLAPNVAAFDLPIADLSDEEIL